MKKIVSLLLASAMTLSLAACGQEDVGQASTSEQSSKPAQSENSGSAEQPEESKYPEYLNLDSQAPILKDEYKGEIKLKVLMVQSSLNGKWDDTWLSKFLSEKYNIELEVESVPESALSERKSTLFAAGDLPDIMLNMALSTDELIRYGMDEQMLLQCDQYINEELTPNIKYYYDTRSDVGSITTCLDGHVYSLPMINIDNPGAYPRVFVNTKMLSELGIEMPTTLEDFNKMVYAVKEADPSGAGSENFIPIAGGSETAVMGYYFLNALGYSTRDTYGMTPALRNGEVVIPAYDVEVYGEYLKLMNQYWNDGIINKDYFTFEGTKATEQLTKKQNLIYGGAIYTQGVTDWADWDCLQPLTSEWNDTQLCSKPPALVGVGNALISADTEYPELCMRFMDIWYAEDSREMWAGPGYDSEYNFGYANAELHPEAGTEWFDPEKLPEGVDLWTYLQQTLVGINPKWGALSDEGRTLKYEIERLGGTYSTEPTFNLEDADQQYRSCVYRNMMPYGVDAFPTTFYLEADKSIEKTDLEQVIQPYIKEQVASFITGRRSLDEIDDFAAELEGMGIEDLLGIYKEIYANYTAH